MKIAIVQNKQRSAQPMMKVKKEHLQKIKKIASDAEIAVVKDIKESILDTIADAEVLIMDPKHLHEPLFKNLAKLKWVHSETAGVNTLPDTVRQSDIIITNASGVHPIPIAEHVFGMMLMFERKLYKALEVQYKQKKWIKDERFYTVGELQGKTIGIVGLGKIGGKIAQLAKAFDMYINAVVRDKASRRLYINELYENTELAEVVGKCDYIINCLPLTPETNHIFNYEIFSKMKPTAYYINIGRGGTNSEADLVRALNGGKIAGAGLDVFEKEPLPEDSPLWEQENVIITPHYSGWTPYYMDRVIDIFCENLKAYLAKEKMPNEIDKKLGY